MFSSINVQWFASHIVELHRITQYCGANSVFHPDEKQHQLNEDAHHVLFDNCCLWVWVREKMVKNFDGEVVHRHDELFAEGCPIYKLRYLTFCNGTNG